jgi:hypothetical protein
MAISPDQLAKLRLVITENLRVQRGGAEPVPYVDVSSALTDISARQNHVVFGRRGCGKTLLLHHSAKRFSEDTKIVYLNCEDFKNHTFPNVLIEILDALFGELEKHLTGWFGKKKKSKDIIGEIRVELRRLKSGADTREERVKEVAESQSAQKVSAGVQLSLAGFETEAGKAQRKQIERVYKQADDKAKRLYEKLPELKERVREFFAISTNVKAVFLQVDDFYHLRRVDQPFVMDYLHRLCKDLPLFFKVATLRHASVLFADRQGQPTGAQERHDFQPINIDFTLSDFGRTERQNKQVLHAFGGLAGIVAADVDGLFKGAGFERLVMAGGGVPRDFLSLFLEVLQRGQGAADSRIGKDDVRILSRTNFERRIEELKQDSEGQDQQALIKGIYVIRQFCLGRQTNVFFVSEQMLQTKDPIRDLLYRLLDYRIIHSVGTAITHKSQPGTFHAFAIDIGCYAHMRTLEGRFTEIDITHREARERMRSAPVLDEATLRGLWDAAPNNPEQALLADEAA